VGVTKGQQRHTQAHRKSKTPNHRFIPRDYFPVSSLTCAIDMTKTVAPIIYS
jgi:hypothetical protein